MPEFINFDPLTHPHTLTNADICVRTTNSIRERVLQKATAEERELLDTHQQKIMEMEQEMDVHFKECGYFRTEDQTALLYMQIDHDLLLEKLQQKYNVVTPTSRSQGVLTPRDGFGNVPFGFSNMARVTGNRMAEAASRRGSWAVFPQGKSDKRVDEFMCYVQSRHRRFLTPVTGTPDTMIRDALYYSQKRPGGHIVQTDERGKIMRILSDAQLRQFEMVDEEMEIGDIPMESEESKIVVGFEDMEADELLSIMRGERLNFLPIVNRVRRDRQRLRWVLTRKEAEAQSEFPPFLDDKERLATAVAVSMFRQGWDKRVQKLIASEVTALFLDSPHAYQGFGKVSQEVVDADGRGEERKVLEVEGFRSRVLWAAQQIVESGRPVRLIVGNVDDPQAVRGIVAAAVEGGMSPDMVTVKVGIGPGHACITRTEAGIGIPQWSAVYECALVARRLGANVQADGGIGIPADVEKYIAAGASHAMVGSIAVALLESAAVLKEDEYGVYGVNYGMGSDVAPIGRSDMGKSKYNEGVRKQRVYQEPSIADVTDFIARFGHGIQSFLLFHGVTTLEEVYKVVRIALQNTTGFHEGLGKKTVGR